MGLRLRILSWWTPKWFLKKSLDELAVSTLNGLEKLLNKELPAKNNEITISSNKNIFFQFTTDLKGDLNERRRIMTRAHNKLVEALINTIGQEEAISEGRKAMYHEGLLLGQKFKGLLGVGDDLEDLITAAKILYTILGIDFVVEEKGENEMIMVVNHCSLANNYNSNTCKVLSAADEGVVHGLNPDIHMKFVERITQGHDHCLASLKMNLRREDK